MTIKSVINQKGLVTNPNPFSVTPEGSLLEAENVVIDDNGTIRSRRGQEKISGAAGQGPGSVNGGGSDDLFRPETCWFFDNLLWAHYRHPTTSANYHDIIVSYTWSGGDWHQVYGSASAITVDSLGKTKTRACEANRRQLITSVSGVLKGAKLGTDGLSTDPLVAAGVPRGLDMRQYALTNTVTYNPMANKQAAGYRSVWKIKDNAGNVQIGSPSGRLVVRNTSGGSRTPQLRIGIPNACAGVLQIYRTLFADADPSGNIVDPGDDMYLIAEISPTSSDQSNFYVVYDDVVVDGLLGTPLYTNESREGVLKGRDVPPVCKDIQYYQDQAFFANTVGKYRLEIDVLAVDSAGDGSTKGITPTDILSVGGITMFATTVALENVSIYAFACDATTGAGSEIVRILKTVESFCYKYNLTSNSYSGLYYAYNATGPDDVVGKIVFEERSINGSVPCYFGATRLDSPSGYLPTPTPGTLVSKEINDITVSGSTVTLTFTAAHGYSIGDQIVFNWFATSTQATNTRLPHGVYTILTLPTTSKVTFSAPAGTPSGTDSSAYAFKKTGSPVSVRDVNLHRLMYSQPQEPEGVPLLNYFNCGRSDAEILRIYPLGQSLFIFKEDGLFRLSGTAGAYVLDIFDATVRLLSSESIAEIDNAVFCLTDVGVVRVSESGCTVMSKEIDDEIQRVIITCTNITRKEAFGVGYSDDRKYILWVPTLSTDLKPTQAFVYNSSTKTWTKRTDSANCGLAVRRNDVITDLQKLYTFKDKENWLTQERKGFSIYDYADESVSLGTVVYSNNTFSSTYLTARDLDLATVGSIITYNNDVTIRNHLLSYSHVSSNGVVTYEYPGNQSEADARTDPVASGSPTTGITLYKSIPIKVTFRHLVGDNLIQRKSFSEVFLTLDQPLTTKMSISFKTDLATTGSTTIWGFGYAFWNSSFPWALRGVAGVILGKTIHTLIPTSCQKCSQLLTTVTNARAWSNFALRGIHVRYTGGLENVVRDNH